MQLPEADAMSERLARYISESSPGDKYHLSVIYLWILWHTSGSYYYYSQGRVGILWLYERNLESRNLDLKNNSSYVDH